MVPKEEGEKSEGRRRTSPGEPLAAVSRAEGDGAGLLAVENTGYLGGVHGEETARERESAS